MKARVKDVQYDIQVDDGGHRDTFVMDHLIGKVINVKPAYDPETKKRWRNWYEDTGRNNHHWNWHKSWLTFLPLQKEKR